MARETVRTTVMFPKELIDTVDQLVGRRRRSAFLSEAVAEKVERERLGGALVAAAGFLEGPPTRSGRPLTRSPPGCASDAWPTPAPPSAS